MRKLNKFFSNRIHNVYLDQFLNPPEIILASICEWIQDTCEKFCAYLKELKKHGFIIRSNWLIKNLLLAYKLFARLVSYRMSPSATPLQWTEQGRECFFKSIAKGLKNIAPNVSHYFNKCI